MVAADLVDHGAAGVWGAVVVVRIREQGEKELRKSGPKIGVSILSPFMFSHGRRFGGR